MDDFDISRIDMHCMRVLVAVYELRSISRAAEQFDLNQSTISHTVEKLRRAIGDPLFVRVGREIEPTQFTHLVIPRARQIVAMMEGLTTRDEMTPNPASVPVTIAANMGHLMAEFGEVGRHIQRDYPGARIRFLELGARDSIDPMLEEARAEAVVSVRPQVYRAALNSRSLFTDESVIFYDRTQRGPIRTVEDYTAARHAVIDFGRDMKSLVSQALAQHSVDREISISAGNGYVLAELMRGTDMVATLPRRYGRTLFAGFAWCLPPLPIQPVHYDLIWHRRNDRAPRSVWLREKILFGFGCFA